MRPFFILSTRFNQNSLSVGAYACDDIAVFVNRTAVAVNGYIKSGTADKDFLKADFLHLIRYICNERKTVKAFGLDSE